MCGAWRDPWVDALPISLDRHLVDPTSLEVVAMRLGFPRLSTLPSELVERVRQFSPQALLWRYISVSELAARVSSAPETQSVVPLSSVGAWKRGEDFISCPSSPSSFIRIVMDLDGIAKVQRLPAHPVGPGRSDAMAYIVETEEYLSGVMAHFKVRATS